MSNDSLKTEQELAKYKKLAEIQWDSDLSRVAATREGRNVLYHIIFGFASVESLSYTGHTENCIFNEGQRKVGLLLLKELQDKFPELYLLMMEEAMKEAADNRAREKRIREQDDGSGPDA